MEIIRNRQSLFESICRLRSLGKTIALVPTMGALHTGHISLVKIAREHATALISSVFINPTQFSVGEDFSRYPRTEKEDLEKLEEQAVDIAYLPSVSEMYPEGFSTSISVGKIAKELCGAFRPGHFDGVATVVTKLLMQTLPDCAVFGEKDYQQLYIIRRLARDLDIPVKIIGAPTIREADGLALSSRNQYLSESERRVAPVLYQTLIDVKTQLNAGHEVKSLIVQAKHRLNTAGFTEVDYIELRDMETLEPVIHLAKPARLLAAATLGTTRLIDNIAIEKK